ncbi:hypothetical protein Tco_0875458 [Tanacetum coccineum]|uniref:Uncharacterized protein n=1 Tax=Tanacetum coccineum TaxID=301880 RepID=A0ABQ5BSE1_9ASTR
MGDEHLSTILETESDKLIKSSVENLVPIPRESDVIFSIIRSTLSRGFAVNSRPINSKPQGIHEVDFDLKEDIRLDDQMFYDYTSSDDDSFEDIDYVEASPPDSELVSIEETFSNHTEETRSGSTTTHAENSLPEYDLFHFEIESDQDELSRAVMETIDEIDAFLDIDVSMDLEDGYHDSEGDIIYLESLLINDTIPNLSPEVFFDHEQKCLKDEPNNLISMVKVFDPGIPEKFFSPTYVRLSFEDRHYLSFTYVIRIFLSYFTYPVEFPFPFSFWSEDIIFDPDIFAYSFYSLEPVACENLMTIFPLICFCPKDKGIRGEIARILKALDMYGYCKNLKKTVKTGQTRTRERKENTRAGRMLSKYQAMIWQKKTHDALIGGNPQDWTRGQRRKHTNQLGFVLKYSQKKHNESDTRNATLAIRVLTHLIQRLKDMIQ